MLFRRRSSSCSCLRLPAVAAGDFCWVLQKKKRKRSKTASDEPQVCSNNCMFTMYSKVPRKQFEGMADLIACSPSCTLVSHLANDQLLLCNRCQKHATLLQQILQLRKQIVVLQCHKKESNARFAGQPALTGQPLDASKQQPTPSGAQQGCSSEPQTATAATTRKQFWSHGKFCFKLKPQCSGPF